MRSVFGSLLHRDTPPGLLAALAAFLVYVLTGAPSIGYWDSAELAAAGATLGIAHPTGYPFFTLLARAFSLAPTGMTPYANLNLMAAVFTATAVFLFYRLFLMLLSGEVRNRLLGGAMGGTRGVSDRMAAATAALALAFSRVVWSEGVSLEVYGLHLVFCALVTLLFLRAEAEPSSTRRWVLFAYALGLSFSHHMMTVLLAPAFLYLFFAAHGFGRAAWRRIALAVPVFALGLTPYLFLPLRAAVAPPVNWGNPVTFADFWTHVSAAQYRFKMFSSSEVAANKLGAFFADLPVAFAVAPLLFALAGLVVVMRRGGRLIPFSILLFATCVAYAVNYDFDDPNFRLQAHVVVALWVAFGLRAMLMSVATIHARGRALVRGGAAAACALVVLIPFDANYRASDRSADYAVEDYARTVLSDVESDALVLTGDLEGLVLGARYLQAIEGVRPDVAVVGLGILAFPWYHHELETVHPGLLHGLESARAAYAPVRAALERTGQSTTAYDLAYTNLVRALLRENVGRRPVYASFVPAAFLQGYALVPQGLLVRVSRDSGLAAHPVPALPARPIPDALPYADKVLAGYAAGFYNHGLYRLSRGETSEARVLLRTTLALDPKNLSARAALASIGE